MKLYVFYSENIWKKFKILFIVYSEKIHNFIHILFAFYMFKGFNLNFNQKFKFKLESNSKIYPKE